jgi:hypothetical protein
MKKVIASFLGLVGAATVISSCGKYEEGPGFTLLSKKARYAGEWSVSNVTFNGTDVTSTFLPSGATYTLTSEKDGTWSSTYAVGGLSSTETGTWELYEDKVIMVTTGSSDTDGDTSTIVLLKNKEMKVKDVSGSDETVIIYTQD